MKDPQKTAKQAENILHAARQLFARQGYHGTSTREIARLADISENTLFRYFERKEVLFWAVLRSSLSSLELRQDLLASMAEGAGPEMVLPQMFTQLIDVTILRPELLRLIAIALVELPWKARSFLYEHLSPALTAVHDYLARSSEHGKLRHLDSSLATTAIVMTTLAHPGLSSMVSCNPVDSSDTREAVRALSRFWLEALLPPWLASIGTAEVGELPPD